MSLPLVTPHTLSKGGSRGRQPKLAFTRGAHLLRPGEQVGEHGARADRERRGDLVVRGARHHQHAAHADAAHCLQLRSKNHTPTMA